MIIGNNKEAVINNIKQAIIDGDLNRKVEINDPKLTDEEQTRIINRYIKSQHKITYKTKSKIARKILTTATNIVNRETKIEGIENIKNIKSGAIITSNHFNPLDNTIIKKFSKKAGKRRLYIVNQITNLAMEGFIGFMMNYSDTIPISKQIGYLKKEFPHIIKELLEKKQFILIYPEEEMWFNYKKPRTLKPGAYYLAAKNNVPIISCFVEMIELDEKDNEEFYKVKYVLHILDPIYPDSTKTVKENSTLMMEKDYNQKKEAYEKIYNKKLDYKFEDNDIAGWIKG
ncbi:MAG: 1-acyl-sn-glycerol-3-phosphate acyltransferase [Clostridia bacterium]|nr:1-acyl-sn-glycerol-3-phosphate acyltransferase [Clostridia bacterium]